MPGVVRDPAEDGDDPSSFADVGANVVEGGRVDSEGF